MAAADEPIEPRVSDEAASDVIGYTDPLAVRPGGTIDLMVSTAAATYELDVVRLRHGDESPHGPGVRWSPAPFGPRGPQRGRPQTAHPGSFGVAPVSVPAGPVTLQAWALPTLVGGARRMILLLSNGVGLAVGTTGHIVGLLPDGTELASARPAEPWSWLFLALVVDADRGLVTLDVRECEWPRRAEVVELEWTGSLSDADHLYVASGRPVPHRSHPGRVDGFDGRIEAPCVAAAALSAGVLDEVAAGEDPPPGTFARWDFQRQPSSDRVPATGALGRPMTLHHCPQRLVLGHDDRADHLGAFAHERLRAAHFHQDDLEDAGWDVDASIAVPDDCPSGVYGARLQIDGDAEIVPFFVRPPVTGGTAHVAVLFPTMSYLAYANERLQDAPRDVADDAERGLPILPDRGDQILKRRHDLGLSAYDVHADGSGCCFSSSRRPILNMRPDHRNWQTHAPRALAADLYLVDWLAEMEIRFDALDDLLLHQEGRQLLDRYRVIVTGAHPEYWSEQMLDALDEYLDGGGRVMYLGGNGFYWVTSVDEARPHLVEIRRGHNGTRSWEPRPGELHHQTTGELGGLWRYRGRGPNRSVGVGFAAQGYRPKAAPFHRTDAADDPRVSWMFAGVPDGPIGDGGLIMGAAAGDEFDRADAALGTPPHALVVATSAGHHSDHESVVVEDLLIAHPRVTGADNPLVRADVVFFETPNGGAVFSAGSMGWTSCLSHAAYGNSLARLTGNVLARFCDPTPFPSP